MLREVYAIRQQPGEHKRRWFFAPDMDLVIWQDEQGELSGMQLAYDKGKGEHSFVWQAQQGFNHYVVDDGEPAAGVNSTPLLYVNGPLDAQYLLASFLAAAAELPQQIASSVADKIREYSALQCPIKFG